MREPRFDEILAQIRQGMTEATYDKPNRERLVRELEQSDPAAARRVAVFYAARDAILSQADILPFASMLKSIGTVERLDLILISSGGDASTAEKMLDLCRKYCSREFRVVVPLHAKSAATLIALGADEIVMGETSELGPIDAQVFVIQDGAEQQVSADHFLRARNEAIKSLGGSAEDVTAAQIQLSLLSPAFLQKCEDLMKFAKDFASKQLRNHMFRERLAEDPHGFESRIAKIVANLTASSTHLIHGRMITAEDVQKDPDLSALRVRILTNADPYWNSLTELLLRTEMVAQSNSLAKVLFASSFFMAANASA